MPKLILLIDFVVSSMVMVGIAIPLIYGWIPPNGLYGFRTPRTLSNPKIWYPVNALAGKRLAAAGLTILVGAIGFYFVPRWQVVHYAIANLAVTVFALGYGILQSFMDLKRIDAAETEEKAIPSHEEDDGGDEDEAT